MLTRTLLCSTLVFSIMSPCAVYADTTITSSAQKELSDLETTAKIKSLYVLSPLIKALDISVITKNQHVALIGEVVTDLQYEEAVSLAQSVDGVRDIDTDKLHVTASKAPIADTYITAKAKGTLMKEHLFGNKSVKYWPVSIETKDGVVYLVGTVETDEQRVNIVTLIEGIDGVKSVESTVVVK